MCLIEFIEKWQTLIGAMLGGVIALLAALVVAYRAERRNDVAAAMHLVGTLVSVRAAGHQLEIIAAEKGLTDPDDRAAWQAEKLAWNKPKLSPLFEASVARIMPLNAAMAAHLQFFHCQYLDLEDKLQRVKGAISDFQRGKEPERGKQYLMADAKSAKRLFDEVVLHADCAEHLLTYFVLSKMAFWHRFWKRWFPDTRTKQCYEHLKGS